MIGPRIVVIVNPRAAGGRAGREWPALRGPVAERLGGTLEDRLTTAPGDATRLTREALRDGADVVVALGGDGSVNEVANGFFAPLEPGDDLSPVRAGAALAVVPFGTGGDFRKTLGLGTDPLAVAESLGGLLRAGAPLPRLDVGVAETTREDGSGRAARAFVNIASCGQSGVVVKYSNTMPKALGGKLTFLAATVRAFFKWKNRAVSLRADGGEPADYIINTLAMGNGRWFGGGMKVCPAAEPADGILDVTVIGDVGLWDFVRLGKKMYDGTIGEIPGVACLRARRVEAIPAGDDPTPVLVELEGESAGRLPATFTLHPGALPVVAELR